MRIALANLPYPTSPADSVAQAVAAIEQAAAGGASIVCFPECYVPGYRTAHRALPPPGADFLHSAWAAIASAAAQAHIAVVLGTERIGENGSLLATALVINESGATLGFQDKVQLDPSEESTYSFGAGRRLFEAAGTKFGIAICHEAWRYPETVRWAARQGAQVVFVPHFHEAEPGSYRPTTFADPGNSFHEKALLCRAAENTCWIAAVNYASEGSPTTSALIRPDGTLLDYQPYGQPGLLFANIDLALATGLLARRLTTA